MRHLPWEPTDHELALRVCDGSDWAFEELARRHVDMIEARAARYGGGGQERDDMRQVVLLALHEAACSYSATKGAGFRYFASVVIDRRLVDALDGALRGKHRMLNESVRLEQTVEIGASGEPVEIGQLIPGPAADDPLAIVLERERLEGVLRIVRRSTPLVQAVVARRVKGMSLHEAGQGLGTAAEPKKTADNALQRLRHELRRAA